ncbi:hypothetical protein DFJ77DRAFT_452764 [Powellomyces hirtus]|nr:hypothetical protein DFJ77DRAFT_452764 [Powellomyces hirtus]
MHYPRADGPEHTHSHLPTTSTEASQRKTGTLCIDEANKGNVYLFYSQGETSKNIYGITTTSEFSKPEPLQDILASHGLFVSKSNPLGVACNWTLEARVENQGSYLGSVFSQLMMDPQCDQTMVAVGQTALETLDDHGLSGSTLGGALSSCFLAMVYGCYFLAKFIRSRARDRAAADAAALQACNLSAPKKDASRSRTTLSSADLSTTDQEKGLVETDPVPAATLLAADATTTPGAAACGEALVTRSLASASQDEEDFSASPPPPPYSAEP